MKRMTIVATFFVTTGYLGVAGAGSTGNARYFAEPGQHEHKEGEKHKEGEHEGEHKGEKMDLGKLKIGAYEVQVTQFGEIKAGEEAVFVITPKGEGEPKAVRAWVGIESGKGSIKTKGEEEKEGEWHAHHTVSKPLPANSKIWIELETANGKQKGSIELKK